MTRSTLELNQILELANAGDEAALGCLLDEYRAYLRILAERHLGQKIQARLDGSDIVQRTYLSACRNFGDFDGINIAQFMAWLRKIHDRNISDAIREHVQAQKRDINREKLQSTESKPFDPPAKSTSPSQRLMLNEESVQLAQLLDHLPTDQREVIRLRHIEGLSIAQVANVMERTESSVTALQYRGLHTLRQKLGKSDQE